jgi:hypothetical protein
MLMVDLRNFLRGNVEYAIALLNVHEAVGGVDSSPCAGEVTGDINVAKI